MSAASTKSPENKSNDEAGRASKTPRSLRHRSIRGFLVLSTVFLTFIAIVKVGGCADRMFFYPIAGKYPSHPEATEVWFENEERRLHGWWFEAKNQPADGQAPTIVFCHGNAFNIKRHTAFMDFLPALGFNVFLFDYRSYGMSDKGPLHRDGLIHDANAAIDYVFSRDDVDPERVGLYGMSLGGTIGLAAAAEDHRIAAVCSLATFSTWEGVSSDFVPVIGPWLISPGRDAIDTAARLGDRPLLILHGTADKIVDFRHASLIVNAAKATGVDVTLSSFEGAGHIDWVSKHPAMRDAIGVFFTEALAPKDPSSP